MPILQRSLSKIRGYEKKAFECKTSQNPPKNMNTSMETVLDDLNALILDQCKSCLESFSFSFCTAFRFFCMFIEPLKLQAIQILELFVR